MMRKNVNKKLGVVLYAIASLLLAYTIWALVQSIGYISEMISTGQLVFAGNEYNIINYYMSNCAQYFVFAVLLAVMGFMISSKFSMQTPPVETPTLVEIKPNDKDDGLDKWFEEMKSSHKEDEE